MKKYLKLSLVAFLTIVSLLPTSKIYAKQEISLHINGNKIHTSAEPFIENGRTLVPVRFVSEALGYQVQWNQKEQKVTISDPNLGELNLYNNKKTYFINGKKKVSDVPAKVLNNVTFVPIRLVADAFDLDIKDTFDSSKNVKIDIETKKAQPLAKAATEYVNIADSACLEGNSIKGKSTATAQQMAAFLLKKNPNPKINCSALELAEYYLLEGEIEGIRGDFAFCQAIKETGYFKYGGDVVPEQNNYAGIGTTGGGVGGASFESPQIGVRAQIQHLKAYATADPLVLDQVDPRYHLVSLGCSPNMEDLNGKWAVPGNGYGQDILAIHASMLLVK